MCAKSDRGGWLGSGCPAGKTGGAGGRRRRQRETGRQVRPAAAGTGDGPGRPGQVEAGETLAPGAEQVERTRRGEIGDDRRPDRAEQGRPAAVDDYLQSASYRRPSSARVTR